MQTETPTFDTLAFEFLDQGQNITAIMARPRPMFVTFDIDTRWRLIEKRFEAQQAEAAKPKRRRR